MKFSELSRNELKIITNEIIGVFQRNNIDAKDIRMFWGVLALGIEAINRR